MNFLKDTRGVAAVEMALISPFLILGLLLMLDIGVAVKGRLDLDHSTRTGAQAVMSNINETQQISDLVLASSPNASAVSVTVQKTCSCGGATVTCTNWCSAKVPPSVFMTIAAERQHKGFLLPAFQLKSQTNVQIR